MLLSSYTSREFQRTWLRVRNQRASFNLKSIALSVTRVTVYVRCYRYSLYRLVSTRDIDKQHAPCASRIMRRAGIFFIASPPRRNNSIQQFVAIPGSSSSYCLLIRRAHLFAHLLERSSLFFLEFLFFAQSVCVSVCLSKHSHVGIARFHERERTVLMSEK